jgi:septal ring factor EnvC (AmiA/AmiB activator)
MEDFGADFADESETSTPVAEEEEDFATSPAELPDDDQILTPRDVLPPADKLSSLSVSLSRSREIANTETNQLYSLLFCVFQDCDLLVAKHRSAIPFSMHDEILHHPPASYERGVVSHPKFPDGVTLSRLDDNDATAFIAFLHLRCDICTRALPPVVQYSTNLLKDPLIRSHNTLRTVKQQISDLRKLNNDLGVQTRQAANRLVRISKTAQDGEIESCTDVILHQQKLQKALARVCSLREENEIALTENTDLQGRFAEQSGRSVNVDRTPRPQVEELQKKIAEVIATNEQSQEECETALAKRRVSLSKMNAAILKAEEEKENLRMKIADVENRLRIMTHGQKGGESVKAAVIVRKVVGSRIPVHLPERAPDA